MHVTIQLYCLNIATILATYASNRVAIHMFYISTTDFCDIFYIIKRFLLYSLVGCAVPYFSRLVKIVNPPVATQFQGSLQLSGPISKRPVAIW